MREWSCPLSCELILNSFHTSSPKHFPNSLAFLFFWSFHKEASVGIYLLPYSSSTLQWNNEKFNNAVHQRRSSKEASFPVFQSSVEMLNTKGIREEKGRGVLNLSGGNTSLPLQPQLSGRIISWEPCALQRKEKWLTVDGVEMGEVGKWTSVNKVSTVLY